MPAEGIVVEGEAEFDRTMRAFAHSASDLTTPNRAAGELLLARALAATPVRSGRLRSSGRLEAYKDEFDLVYDAVYAGVIHNGWPEHDIDPQPWLLDTVDESHTVVAEVYEHWLEAEVHQVRGA